MFYSECTIQHRLTFAVRNDDDYVHRFSCGKDNIVFGSTKKR